MKCDVGLMDNVDQPSFGLPISCGNLGLPFGSVYQEGLPLFPIAIKQLLSDHLEAWEGQVPTASDLECH